MRVVNGFLQQEQFCAFNEACLFILLKHFLHRASLAPPFSRVYLFCFL
ncbi:hypothetical protein IFVP18_C1130011 [Vibrio parahaemolyticus]